MRAGSWAWAAVVVACALGCGGTTASQGADAGGGASDGGISPCPATAPSSGSACTQQGLTCEWGTSPVPECDTTATCTGGSWNVPLPNPGGLGCQPGMGGTCPSSFAGVPRNAHCSPYGLYCDYPQGRCACTVAAGPEPLDASAAAQWLCQDPQAGCPQPRPPLGSACTQEGLQCDYGACTIPGGTGEQCTGGVWVDAPVACPAIAGR